MSNEVDEWVRAGQRRNARWRVAGAVASTIAIVALFLWGAITELNGCQAGDDRVTEALKGAGLASPVLGGVDIASCADSESSRHFTATNAQGQTVEGTVCCGITGIGKGCTIRWGR